MINFSLPPEISKKETCIFLVDFNSVGEETAAFKVKVLKNNTQSGLQNICTRFFAISKAKLVELEITCMHKKYKLKKIHQNIDN